MKRKIIIPIGIVIVLATSLFVVFNTDNQIRYLFSPERIGSYEVARMRESRHKRDASVILTHNDIEWQFPLPNGAVLFDNDEYPVGENSKQFLIVTEAFRHYLYEILPQHGYNAEQWGSWVRITNNDNSVRIGMSTHMFTRNFMRIILSVEE